MSLKLLEDIQEKKIIQLILWCWRQAEVDCNTFAKPCVFYMFKHTFHLTILVSQSLPAVVNYSFTESTDIRNTTQLIDWSLNKKTSVTNIVAFAENLGSSGT